MYGMWAGPLPDKGAEVVPHREGGAPPDGALRGRLVVAGGGEVPKHADEGDDHERDGGEERRGPKVPEEGAGRAPEQNIDSVEHIVKMECSPKK